MTGVPMRSEDGSATGGTEFGGVHNELFRPGSDMRLNACVGLNGGPAGFDRYASGYFEAANRLIVGLKNDPYEVDSLVYPIVMLYRHGIEIALKHLGKVLPFLCDATSVEVKFTHRLLDNWRIVRKYLAQLDEAQEVLDRIERAIKNIVELDPKGEAFRYPESRDGTPFLHGTSIINLEVFGTEMAFLKMFFEGSCLWADDLTYSKCEALEDERRSLVEAKIEAAWNGFDN